MEWSQMVDERDDDGLLTTLALALDAIKDNGCDCGTDEPGTCLACLCEAALKDLWQAQAESAARYAKVWKALSDAQKSLLFISRAGSRPPLPHVALLDLIDVRGYANRRAQAAFDAMEEASS